MKKLLAVVLAVAMLLGMVSIASADDVQEITWMFWDDLDASSDLITQGFKQVIDRFNEDYAGKYHVTPITTQLEPYYEDLNGLIEQNKTPDVFIVSPGPNLTNYVAPGIVAPLDEYLEADGWKDTFAGDAVFAQQTYDGKIYAIPLNTAPRLPACSTTGRSSKRPVRQFRPPTLSCWMPAKRSRLPATPPSPSPPVPPGACPCWLATCATVKASTWPL